MYVIDVESFNEHNSLKQNKAKKKTFKISQKHKKPRLKHIIKIISSNHLIPKSFWPLK